MLVFLFKTIEVVFVYIYNLKNLRKWEHCEKNSLRIRTRFTQCDGYVGHSIFRSCDFSNLRKGSENKPVSTHSYNRTHFSQNIYSFSQSDMNRPAAYTLDIIMNTGDQIRRSNPPHLPADRAASTAALRIKQIILFNHLVGLWILHRLVAKLNRRCPRRVLNRIVILVDIPSVSKVRSQSAKPTS
jgi:hypothetical protein